LATGGIVKGTIPVAPLLFLESIMPRIIHRDFHPLHVNCRCKLLFVEEKTWGTAAGLPSPLYRSKRL
jgi:hypothetical protein